MRFHEEGWMHALTNPLIVYALPIFWVFAVYGFASHMTTRRAFQVKRAMQVYNIVQIVVCIYMVWGLSACIQFPNVFGINTAYSKDGEWFVFVHFLSKFLDWFDTLWIMMKKNRAQLSFLHVYHHATIGMVWGYLLRSGVGSGTAMYGAWANSLTHVIMYSHYLWTSFGYKNPFKKYITMWQIGQFYSCFTHAWVVRFLENTETWKVAWLQVVYQSSMIYLFSFKMSYVPSCVPNMSNKDEPEPAAKKTK
jgi:hypothetical protein